MTDLLASPAPLFFVFGLAIARFHSRLSLPASLAKSLAAYLMVVIGLKGGSQLQAAGLTEQVLLHAVAAVALGVVLTFIAFGLLRMITRLNKTDLAALAAHYGSVSVVTFVAASGYLIARGVSFEGHLIGLMAIMEAPAIVTAVWLAKRGRGGGTGHSLVAALTNWSVLLLGGGLVAGYVAGVAQLAATTSLLVAPFAALLCVFLLEMGLQAGKKLVQLREMGPALLAFAVAMPLVGAALGSSVGLAVGLSVGGATLLAVLAASASYIAAPAAVRLALPAANPTIYGTLPLGVTFPFNVTLGIPPYYALTTALGGALL